MSHEDFECFRMAFDYCAQHRFATMGRSVEGLHLVGHDGDLHPDFERMLVSVYHAIRQGRAVVELSDYVGRRRVIEVPQEVSSMDTFTYEIAYMCRCVSSESRSFLNEEVGAEVMAVVDAAYYSEMLGRRAVTLDEFKEFSAKLAERFGDRASDEFIKMKVRHVAGHLPPREVLAFCRA